MKALASHWSDCDQIFFNHGKAWGLNDDLSTVCLGDEESVKAYLAGEKVEHGLNLAGQAALDWIIEYREQEGFSNDRLNERSMERDLDNEIIRDQEDFIEPFEAGDGLAERDVDTDNKGLFGRGHSQLLEGTSKRPG